MIKNLAYIGFVTPKVDEWRSFGPDVLGAQIAPDADGSAAVRLRVDESAWRIGIHPGERNDVAYFGWEVADDELASLLDRVRDFGCEITEGDDGLIAERQVGRLHWFTDHAGFRHELVNQIAEGDTFTPGRNLNGSFVTGEQGLGHIVLMVPDADKSREFVTEVLGMRPSDTVTAGRMNVEFFHCAGHQSRHHTLATVAVPDMAGLFHLMLEVTDLDDVGTALDVVKKQGMDLPMDLGKHPNDLMTSFYVRGPSGFDIEYGFGGRVVDDDTWEVTTYDQVSIWGHLPPEGGAPRPGIMRPVS